MKLRVFFSFILSSILFTISCSKVNKNHKDHIFDDGVAQWIQDRKKLPTNDSLFYLEEQAPLFRKDFRLEKEVKNATLFITSAGYYAALNVDGSGVTEEWLGGSAPGSANAGGYDILSHKLIKTATDTWICLSNVQNYA